MNTIKLSRPIKEADGDVIDEIVIPEINGSHIMNMELKEKMVMGDLVKIGLSAANISETLIPQLHPSDMFKIAGVVGNALGGIEEL